MLAEKCPNCGAFLPVRRAGVAVRTCEFCELEVPGGVPVVEVERLTIQRPAVSAPADATSDWLPPRTPPRVRPDARSGRRMIVVLIAIPLMMTALIAGLVFAIGWSTRRALKLAVPSPQVELVRVDPPLAPPRPEQTALIEAVKAAGGVSSLDPLAMMRFVDGRARVVADDAVLLSVQCFPVRAGGRADLTLASGRCQYEYRSPSGMQRPAGVPVGVAVDLPCLIEVSIDKDADDPDARLSRNPLRICTQHHAVRPPRCTVAQIWDRAVAKGAPVDAVARMRYAGRYQSGYDPVDASDEVDRPERGRWAVTVERDGAPDIRLDTADDCGQGPPSADERAVLTALKKAHPALQRCFDKAAGGERSIEALEAIWRLTIDGRGAVTLAFADPGVDIEGVFQGDLDAIRSSWATCADGVARSLRLPAALREIRLELRFEQGGKMVVAPPPYD